MIILFLMVTVAVATATDNGPSDETFLVGPMDFDGFCPEPSHKYGKSCCCATGCCWSNCRKGNPPLSCLDGVPNSQWVFNRDKLWYQAVRNFNHQGCNVNNTFWPMDCPDLTVPKSLVKVKVWYDNGFLQSKQIQTHEKAKEFIYATMAHVQHFMCSSSIGTVLETEVNITFRLLYRFIILFFFSWLKLNTCKICTSMWPVIRQSKIWNQSLKVITVQM